MTRRGSKIRTILLSAVWLAVVCGALALAIAGRGEYGIQSYLAIGLAVIMLVFFVINYLPRKMQKQSLTELSGKLFTGLVILVIILFLAASLVKGYKNFGIIGCGVILLFLVVFIRIFIDFVKDFNKQSRKTAGKTESTEE